jgi:hypothetical protein
MKISDDGNDKLLTKYIIFLDENIDLLILLNEIFDLMFTKPKYI